MRGLRVADAVNTRRKPRRLHRLQSFKRDFAGRLKPQIATTTLLILRSLRSKRLEGWPQAPALLPSFETHRLRDAPQDEVGDTFPALRTGLGNST
jgi:hypothetical protein